MPCTLKHLLTALALLSTASLSAADVSLYRSTEMKQTGPATFEFTCVVEYSGVHPSEEYRVDLNLLHGGTSAGPASAKLGPGKRNEQGGEDGKWSYQASMKGKTLRIERVLYIAGDAKGTAYACQGSGENLSTGETLPSTRVVDFNL